MVEEINEANQTLYRKTVTQLPTDKLKKLMDVKHQCLVQLRDLGAKQCQLIGQNDMGLLLKLLVLKQQAITKLQAVEKKLDPYREESPEDRIWRTSADRAQCATVAQTCRDLLDEVVRMEKTNESRMVIKRDETASKLQQAHAANRAREAYAMQGSGN